MNRYQISQSNTACVSKTVVCVDEHEMYKWKVPTERMLWTNSIITAHDFVTSGGGKSLHNLIIGEGMFDNLNNVKDLVADFRDACPNVRLLSVVDTEGMSTYAFARQLEKLEVSSPRLDFPESCPCLLGLNFSYDRQTLNTYGHFHKPGSVLRWNKVGSKLSL